MPNNLGDTTTCALCGRVVVNVGPDTWDHVDAADHRAAPTTLREQGLTDALHQMMREIARLRQMTKATARHYAKRRANAQRAWRYRTQLRDLESSLLFEYTGRMAAEARAAELEAAIRMHWLETASGTYADRELWRHLEGNAQ